MYRTNRVAYDGVDTQAVVLLELQCKRRRRPRRDDTVPGLVEGEADEAR